jgi:N-acetylglucosamine-6-phosphate deacetylase
MRTFFTNARLILEPDAGIVEGGLLMEEGVIREVITGCSEGIADGSPFSAAEEVIDCGGDYLAPGLVDIHCHGALGSDAMGASREAFLEILRHHASRGTTTALLTTVAAPLGDVLRVLATAAEFAGEHGIARLAGIHLEGPYFSPARRGAHRAEELRLPSIEETSRLLEHAAVIRRMTLAPELAGVPELLRELAAHGISASAGHSDASEEEAAWGFRSGITQATHLYNCMSSLHSRDGIKRSGLAEEALVTKGVLCEVVADGIHLPPALLRLAWLAKGWGELVIVSDATAGAGLPEGSTFALGGLSCQVRGGASWTAESGQQRLAGSTIAMIDGVRIMTEQAGIPLIEAIAMASFVPARSLGLDHEFGSIASGKRADLIRFDESWTLKGVWMGGKMASKKVS